MSVNFLAAWGGKRGRTPPEGGFARPHSINAQRGASVPFVLRVNGHQYIIEASGLGYTVQADLPHFFINANGKPVWVSSPSPASPLSTVREMSERNGASHRFRIGGNTGG